MASSSRHWPSMFRSKPSNPQHQHQWQNDINSSTLPSGCHQTRFSSSACAEKTPEPKARWNPKSEQIRILESLFDSGMVNPTREEIRKIRAQLQEYGQVGDANVFYWFQNRKSRSKHKLRHLQNSKQQKQNNSNSNGRRSGCASMTSPTSVAVLTQSPPLSSPPYGKPSSQITTQLFSEPTALSLGTIIDQADYFPVTEIPMLFPLQQGFSFSAALPSPPSVSEETGVLVGPSSSLLPSDQLGTKMTSPLGYPSLIGDVDKTSAASTVAALSVPGENSHHGHGVPEAVDLVSLGEVSQSTVVVFINDIAFQVSSGPFSVRETIGDHVVLINSAGLLVETDQWGVTLHPLQHGASYYLI